MAHARTQIRKAIKDLLLPVAVFQAHIFTSRFSNLQLSELPSANIFCLVESATPADIHNAEIDRVLQVGISIKTAVTDDIDDVLDELAEQVELVIDANTTLGGIVKSLSLVRTQIQTNEDGAEPVGEALLQYQVNYGTEFGDPSTTV